jgi:hypothetical protein
VCGCIKVAATLCSGGLVRTLFERSKLYGATQRQLRHDVNCKPTEDTHFRSVRCCAGTRGPISASHHALTRDVFEDRCVAPTPRRKYRARYIRRGIDARYYATTCTLFFMLIVWNFTLLDLGYQRRSDCTLR